MIRMIVLMLALACPAVAFGQGAATATASAPKRQLPPGFERVAGAPEKEQLDPNPLVVGAYVMFFVMMFGYIVYVARQQSAIAREMTELAERIRKAEKK